MTLAATVNLGAVVPRLHASALVTRPPGRKARPMPAPRYRISSTGALQDLSISLVVEPSTKARILE